MASGKRVSYDYLIVAAGLQINWGKIKGLKETIGEWVSEWVTSMTWGLGGIGMLMMTYGGRFDVCVCLFLQARMV